ncbi:MAG: helix-turn-helix domain-containing protein, partial [Gemmatimonadaceae bacterium]
TYTMPMTVRKASVKAPPAFDRGKVYQVRERLGVSQAVMAKLMNVSAPTVRSWEQGGRKPAGAAVRLLEIAATHPHVVLGAARARRSRRRQRTA